MKKGYIMAALLGLSGGAVGGTMIAANNRNRDIEKWKAMSDKHLTLFLLMNEWMKTKQKGKSIADYFKKNGYKMIAIYGMSYVGERLLDELKDSGIEVKYAIDKNADSLYSQIDIHSLEDELADVDAVIVTPVTFFKEIEEKLSKKMDCPILSIENILYEL